MKKNFLATLITFIIVIAFILIGQCFYTVNPDQYANTLRFSKTVNTVSDAGMQM